MPKIIQLRGANGCGKTTAISQFIEHYGLGIDHIVVGNREYELYTNGAYCVIARRRKDGSFTGLDGIVENREVLVNLVVAILREKRPDVLVFEGLIYGLSYLLAQRLSDIGQKMGYEYKAICLYCPLPDMLQRIYGRNGGKKINEDAMLSKYNQNVSAFQKIKAAGIYAKLIDTTKVRKTMMYTLIEDEL